MLKGKVIAVSESRQLDILVQLFEAREADVLRIPMISIHDVPDPEPVLAWMQQFIEKPCDDFIIFTGEGVRRLLNFAEKNSLEKEFLAALEKVRKICRGPKPNRALKEVGLNSDLQAIEPTTDGIIESLAGMSLKHHRVAVQLYGEESNQKLMDFLSSQHAEIFPVAPYIYADKSEEIKVLQLIQKMDAGLIDVIVFTSQPQFKRLQQTAKTGKMESQLISGLNRTLVAAIGPVVKEQLMTAGIRVDIMPQKSYFMKPLVMAIVRHLQRAKNSTVRG